MSKRKITVRHRDERYAERYRTAIWQERADGDNPFIETDVRCRGYALEDLVGSASYADVVFLMLRGELPTAVEKSFFEKIMVAFCSPGVRSEATRAGILAGVGKTLSSHVLPTALLVYGGHASGAGSVEEAMRFLRKSQRKSPDDIVESDMETPGFAAYYGGIDTMAAQMSSWLQRSDVPLNHLQWGDAFVAAMQKKQVGKGWTKAGVAAAAFCDLGIQPRYGVGLLQMIAAPGLLAQAMEHANKPATILPFVSDDDYELADD